MPLDLQGGSDVGNPGVEDVGLHRSTGEPAFSYVPPLATLSFWFLSLFNWAKAPQTNPPPHGGGGSGLIGALFPPLC